MRLAIGQVCTQSHHRRAINHSPFFLSSFPVCLFDAMSVCPCEWGHEDDFLRTPEWSQSSCSGCNDMYGWLMDELVRVEDG